MRQACFAFWGGNSPLFRFFADFRASKLEMNECIDQRFFKSGCAALTLFVHGTHACHQSWTGANEAVGNVKSFNNHGGSRGLPRFADGIHWATSSPLTTPFTEGCPRANGKASPPGRHQEQAPEQRCTFRPTRSVQFSSDVRLFII